MKLIDVGSTETKNHDAASSSVVVAKLKPSRAQQNRITSVRAKQRKSDLLREAKQTLKLLENASEEDVIELLILRFCLGIRRWMSFTGA